MSRRLALLFLLVLSSLSLSANEPIDPKARYNAVFTMTRPDGIPDDAWAGVVEGSTMFKSGSMECRADGNKLYKTYTNTLGEVIQKNIGSGIENPWRYELKWKLTKCEKVPPTPEEIELEKINKRQAEEDKARQKLADENDPRRTVDAKGKPIYNAGSPEAEKQLRESAAEQDKSAANFKQYNQGGTNGPVTGEGLLGKPVYNAGSPEAEAQLRESAQEQDKAAQRHRESGAGGNGPVTGEGLLGKPVKNTGTFDDDDEAFAAGGAQQSKAKSAGSGFPDEPEDRRPLSQRIMNRPANPAPTATPRATGNEPAERLAPTSGNKYSKPVTPPSQGTKKNDTLFKNQQPTPPVPPRSE